MKSLHYCLIIILLFTGCRKETEIPESAQKSDLELFISLNNQLETDFLVACAGGNNNSFMEDSIYPISIFYYPFEGAHNVHYYETEGLVQDELDYSQYNEIILPHESLFNGSMKKFSHPAVSTEKWCIITYLTQGTLHICDPIRLKPQSYPTNDVSQLISITENGITPSFDWSGLNNMNNVIYFQIVSDTSNNFLTGTYTTDQFWSFYDTSNVVFNMTVSDTTPELFPNHEYDFTLMGVSEDNWIHSMGLETFSTN